MAQEITANTPLVRVGKMTGQPRENSQAIIDRLSSLFPHQDETATRIALTIYRQLAQFDRVMPQMIADRASVQVEDVEARLSIWPAVYRDEEGAVIGFWGLTGRKMPHRFTVAGRDRYTWCAWDALFIPELIGETALVESTTPIHNRLVRLAVGSGRATVIEPEDAQIFVSFPGAVESEWQEDVISNFCHHVYFLHADEVDQWLEEHSDAVVLGLNDAMRAGHEKNSHQFQGLERA